MHVIFMFELVAVSLPVPKAMRLKHHVSIQHFLWHHLLNDTFEKVRRLRFVAGQLEAIIQPVTSLFKGCAENHDIDTETCSNESMWKTRALAAEAQALAFNCLRKRKKTCNLKVSHGRIFSCFHHVGLFTFESMHHNSCTKPAASMKHPTFPIIPLNFSFCSWD